jgi:hypothetical protein
MDNSLDASMNAKYSRERVMSIIARVRRIGGLPMPSRPLDQFQSWFRTLAKRGYTQPDFLRDEELVRQTFRRDFPNTMTRSQYVRGFLMYLTGLNDDEFAVEFPGIDREELVKRLQSVGTEANKEREKERPRRRNEPSRSDASASASAFDTN